MGSREIPYNGVRSYVSLFDKFISTAKTIERIPIYNSTKEQREEIHKEIYSLSNIKVVSFV